MSGLNINLFFQFSNSVVYAQEIPPEGKDALFFVRPNKRYRPVCHQCGESVSAVHSYHWRIVRDMNIAQHKVYLKCHYRKLRCPTCGFPLEKLDYVDPYLRVTTRLAQYIVSLCEHLTVKKVAEHLGLDWKTVKEIDKAYLKEKFGETDYKDLHIIAIDEIAIRKGHSYLTVVIDWETGRIVWMGEGRSKATIDKFFQQMPESARHTLWAVAMDMWKPYIDAVSQWCPEAKIVFDFFHVVAAFNRVIDQVRNDEYKNAQKEHRKAIKGTKYLLTMNSARLSFEGKLKLFQALELNQNLSKIYILKDYLKLLWQFRSEDKASWFLDYWCQLAIESGLQPVIKFAQMLQNHRQGILNHCYYQINTSKLEGINNSLKVLKRTHYGFHDLEYYILKAKSLSKNCN